MASGNHQARLKVFIIDVLPLLWSVNKTITVSSSKFSPPSELLDEIEKLVQKYPGVELAPVEYEADYTLTACRPSVSGAPPLKKSKKG